MHKNCHILSHLPIYFFFKKSFVTLSQNKIKIKNNFFFFDYFLSKYFSTKIKKNIFLKLDTKNFFFLESNKYLNWVVNLMKRSNSLFFLNQKNLKKILEVFLLTMYNKDTKFFSNWIKSTMENLYYKNHKKFLMFLKNIIFFLFKYLNVFLNIKGLKFLLKGKIALGGNSKKKKFDLKIGQFSLTKKNSFINFNKDFIKTVSGTLGFSFFIFF